MPTKHVSLRMDAEVYDRLERRRRQLGRRRPELINRYIDEGLRMEDHPGIVFRSGPAGRRAALANGPDVWEVLRVVHNLDTSGEEVVDETARWLGLRREQVEAALRYYADYTTEIDDWLARLEDEAAHQQQLWERRQGILE